jgi:hypothetical protein
MPGALTPQSAQAALGDTVFGTYSLRRILPIPAHKAPVESPERAKSLMPWSADDGQADTTRRRERQ